MKPQYAVIDIGSNSVRLMLGAEENGRTVSLQKTRCTTRLAMGLNETHRLRADRMAESVQAIEAFKRTADRLQVPVIAYATSAVRDAENRDEFLAEVLDKTGLSVLVLSGEEEGRYAYLAATGGTGTVFDIGGGSFQAVSSDFALSFPCGCVRAKEQCDASDPKELERVLFAWLDEQTNLPEHVPAPVYGVGGTISTIGALLAGLTEYDVHRLADITPHKLDGLIQLLAAIPEPKRMQMPLLKKRGDVILQGATILRYQMVRTHTDVVHPSDRDGSEGIADAVFLKQERL